MIIHQCDCCGKQSQDSSKPLDAYNRLTIVPGIRLDCNGRGDQVIGDLCVNCLEWLRASIRDYMARMHTEAKR